MSVTAVQKALRVQKPFRDLSLCALILHLTQEESHAPFSMHALNPKR